MPRTGAGSTNLSPAIHSRTRPMVKRSSGSPILWERWKRKSKIFITPYPFALFGDRAPEVCVRDARDGDVAGRLRRRHRRTRGQQMRGDAGIERDGPYLPGATVIRAGVARPHAGDPKLARSAVGHLVEGIQAGSGLHMRWWKHGTDDAVVEEQASLPHLSRCEYGRRGCTEEDDGGRWTQHECFKHGCLPGGDVQPRSRLRVTRR